MENTINFGIDLGTTNSLIAKNFDGEIIVFKNPRGHKEVLPSVVAYRNERLLVGEKANEIYSKDAKSVVARFKRKMGTDDVYIMDEGIKFTPTELSSIILKELKQFVHTGENVDAAVITVPASFDTMQTNATIEAGKLAGLKEVILIQEPIAASLAFANQSKIEGLDNITWIVYDFGGGTFDVALVRIINREMKIIDNLGNNYLGGSDLDKDIAEKLLFDKIHKNLENHYDENELDELLTKNQAFYHKLLYYAENIKIDLSSMDSSDLEIEVSINDKIEYISIKVDRWEIEKIIEPYLDETINHVKELINRNNLDKNSIKFILLVGGSTYIPLVRNKLQNALKIPVNSSVDPTNAVVIGAAFYAGTKNKTFKPENEIFNQEIIKCQAAYSKSTPDETEFIAIKILDYTENMHYRIARLDSGYDSGMKSVSKIIEEILPLVPKTYNLFEFKLFDKEHIELKTDLGTIGIMQGQFSLSGQPLPDDISIEIDKQNTMQTCLELIFAKNSILPLQKKIYKTISKTLSAGNYSDQIYINLLEGPHTTIPTANLSIGMLKISGKEISQNLLKGTDLDIIIDIDESRVISVKALHSFTNQEFQNIFQPASRSVDIIKLLEELYSLAQKVKELINSDNYNYDKLFKEWDISLNKYISQLSTYKPDDTNDLKFKIDAEKRKLAQEINKYINDTLFNEEVEYYFSQKRRSKEIINKSGTMIDSKEFDNITMNEKVIIEMKNLTSIKDKAQDLRVLAWKINKRDPQYLKDRFYLEYENIYEYPKDATEKALPLIQQAYKAIETEDYNTLSKIIISLSYLKYGEDKDKDIFFGETGYNVGIR